MEGSNGLDRKAFILANIIIGFDFKNEGQEYHAKDFLAHFNASNIPVNIDEIKLSLCEHSFQKVLMTYGLEYSTHKTPDDVYEGGPQRGKRIKNSFGGICRKVLGYEFPGIDENISCNYSDARRIEGWTEFQ
jgi:hypothetical protein